MYNIEGVEHFLRCVGGPMGLAGKSICELGDQLVWEHAMKRYGIAHSVARDWFLNQTDISSYVSIDTNGQNGALTLDLTCLWPLPEGTPADIVTDIGTMEHVDLPGREASGQMAAFSNIHRLCKVGGLMIHQLPPVGQWDDHCRIRYRSNLPEVLAQANGYEIVNNEVVNLATLGGHVDYLAFALRKTNDNSFDAHGLMTAIEVDG